MLAAPVSRNEPQHLKAFRSLRFCSAPAEEWHKTGISQGMLISRAEGEAAWTFWPGSGRLSAMGRAGDGALLAHLKEPDARRLLRQRFKLRDLMHTLKQCWPVQKPGTA